MFVDKASSLAKSGAAERFFTQVGSALTRKYQARLERLVGTLYLIMKIRKLRPYKVLLDWPWVNQTYIEQILQNFYRSN